MLKQKYILFVHLIISKIHLQTQYALMFTFLANYYLKNKTKHTNKLILFRSKYLDVFTLFLLYIVKFLKLVKYDGQSVRMG